MYRSKHNHEEQQTIKQRSDNRVRQSRLRIRASVSVGFLISLQNIFKYIMKVPMD
jgi:hypothetical protein